MKTFSMQHRTPLVAVIVLFACDTQPNGPILAPSLSSFANSEWSAPVNLGSEINSPFADNNPTLSSDELTMYFASDRPGGLGLVDIWVTRRASLDSPWETPVNLGAPVNSPFIDGAPALSSDGHLLFFHSNRTGSAGGNDIWLARRSGSTGDDGWDVPIALGPDVNTSDDEQGPDYTVSAGGGAVYFNRGAQAVGRSDLYYAEVGHDGRTGGPAVAITELNDPTSNDAAPTVRTDGKEILFWSARASGGVTADMWVSTRQNPHESWSPPQSLGVPMNSPVNDLHPELSHDSRTLYFSTNRPGGFGGQDLWMSTRTPSGN
jgi:Tol biopolymer transport system component